MEQSDNARLAARRDIAAGVVLFGTSAVLAVSLYMNESVRLAAAAGRDPGPAFLPLILIALLAAGSVGLTLRAALVLAREGRVAVPSRAAGMRRLVFPTLMVSTMAGYVLALQTIGFVAATASFAALWSVLVGWQENGRPRLPALLRYLVEAALITALIWFVFGWVIKVPLP